MKLKEAGRLLRHAGRLLGATPGQVLVFRYSPYREQIREGRKEKWPPRMGLGKKGGVAPCVVTVCEHLGWWLVGLKEPTMGVRRGGSHDGGQGGPSLRLRARQAATQRPLLPSQRNPSAEGRALILITPRPLASGVTSATPALSSSF